MTDTSPPRCPVPMLSPALDLGLPYGGDVLCGEPLVRAESGPCETCGHSRIVHGRITGICIECLEVHMGDEFPKPDAYHPYQPPLACPVHGGRP